MKNGIKYALAAAVSIPIMLTLAGCGGSGIANTDWTLDRMITEEMEIDASMLAYLDMKIELTFTGSEFSMVLLDETVKGTFSQNEDLVSLTANGMTISATLMEDTLTIRQEHSTIILKKKH